jgi:ABC-2 type transport system ATP-binding protein
MSAGNLVSVDSPDNLLATAGPEILRVVTSDVPGVVEFLHSKCGLHPHSLEGEVRASATEAHAVAARLTAEMPAAVTSTTISKPTLEDVFLFKTGKRLNE